MNYLTRTGKPLPQSILDSAEAAKKDPVNRREFLALASAFGVTTATAYSMIGMATKMARKYTPIIAPIFGELPACWFDICGGCHRQIMFI